MKKPHAASPVSAGAILEKALRQLGLTAAMSRHSVVLQWPRIVDTAIAKHASAEKVEGGTLHVLVDSSVYMNELAALKPTILARVNALLDPDAPPITDIRFRQSSALRIPKASAPKTVIPELNEEEIEEIRRAVEPIKDGELRSAFERLLKKDKLLKKSGRIAHPPRESDTG